MKRLLSYHVEGWLFFIFSFLLQIRRAACISIKATVVPPAESPQPVSLWPRRRRVCVCVCSTGPPRVLPCARPAAGRATHTPRTSVCEALGGWRRGEALCVWVFNTSHCLEETTSTTSRVKHVFSVHVTVGVLLYYVQCNSDDESFYICCILET